MADRKKLELNPYHRFSKTEWAQYRDGEPMTLTAADIERLRALTDPISLAEAEEIYLPLSRLISFYVEAAQAVHRVSTRFLGTEDHEIPFIIGVAGSVASGKSTTSRILRTLLQRWRTSPQVDLITTDGFLYPNAELERRGLTERKGFPESYDRAALLAFLADIKSGKSNVKAPVYSHLVYDIVPGEFVTLGTDGFGFSDTRPAARRVFNVDAQSIVVGALQALAAQGRVAQATVAEAAARYRIDDVNAAPKAAPGTEGGDA